MFTFYLIGENVQTKLTKKKKRKIINLFFSQCDYNNVNKNAKIEKQQKKESIKMEKSAKKNIISVENNKYAKSIIIIIIHFFFVFYNKPIE